ncbi:MAG: fibronectin type III domain-containing protein, partial [Eubacteriales bacterium]|nr:fibronectin type III domain-containing protein [Eubacteriales bacterium]
MKHTWSAKILSTAIAACLAFSSMPAFADGTKQIKVTLTDVTATDAATQYGEAKIKVSILGADGNISAVQNAFTFEGLDYKNVQFLKGENNPPECVWVSPDKAKANADKKFSVGIAAPGGIAFGDNEEVYIITFYGEPGEKVTLNVADGTFCVTDGGSKITASADGMCEAAASAKENKSIDAVIKLTMDKITGFNAAAETGITLKITSQTTKGYLITDILSNKAVQEGGHRESTDIPTFTVKNSVLAGDKYTVELYGAGYVTYKKTDVTFDKPLEITNADFVPGDVNDDGKVDADDKALAEKSKNGDYNEAADFDRNGKTDSADMKVFDGISDKTVPTKMTAPTVTGGSKKITVKWTKPTDESITGYTIKYGTSKDTLTGTKEIDKADTVSADITELSANTAYYLQIAAKNAAGTGEFS